VLSEEKTKEHPCQPDPTAVIGSVVVVGLLIFLAYRFRNSVVASHTIRESRSGVAAIGCC